MTEPPWPMVVNDAAGRWQDVPSASVSVELQNLQQLYALLTDQGNAAGLVALFTSDAVWDGRELNYGTATGAENIARHVVEHFDVDQPMMHLPGPLLLAAVSDHEVQGISWCMATRWVGDQVKPVIFFSYRDVFRQDEPGGWRFSCRVLRSRAPSPREN